VQERDQPTPPDTLRHHPPSPRTPPHRSTMKTQERTEAAMVRMSPLRRVGEPEDIARAVLYLASDASSFMTGQILRPNGGVSMPW
ncbi:SDR family oxidoreductase, partial [Streptomyces virginiae]